jgi:hypothetical protein
MLSPLPSAQSNGKQSTGFAAQTPQFTNIIPPPGGGKRKNTKQSTVQQTKMVCCTVLFYVMGINSVFDHFRRPAQRRQKILRGGAAGIAL